MHRKEEEIRGNEEGDEGETADEVIEGIGKEEEIEGIEGSEDGIDGTERENVMKMSYNEVRVMKNDIEDIVSENETSEATEGERDEEANDEEERSDKEERRGVESSEPVEELDASGNSDDGGRGGEVGTSVNIKSNDEHMMASDNATEKTNEKESNEHGITTEDNELRELADRRGY
jgi:hypothetical protein